MSCSGSDSEFRKKFSLTSYSRLTLDSKLLLYETILKPTWTYGIPLWGTTSNSNTETLQRFENTVLGVLVNAPWYVTNGLIHRDLNVPAAREVITKLCTLLW